MRKLFFLLLLAATVSSCMTTKVTRDVVSDDGIRSIIGSSRQFPVGQERYVFTLAMQENVELPQKKRRWLLQVRSRQYIPEEAGLTLVLCNSTTCYLPNLSLHVAEKSQIGGERFMENPYRTTGDRNRYVAVYCFDDEIMERIAKFGIKNVRVNDNPGFTDNNYFMNGFSEFVRLSSEKIIKEALF